MSGKHTWKSDSARQALLCSYSHLEGSSQCSPGSGPRRSLLQHLLFPVGQGPPPHLKNKSSFGISLLVASSVCPWKSQWPDLLCLVHSSSKHAFCYASWVLSIFPHGSRSICWFSLTPMASQKGTSTTIFTEKSHRCFGSEWPSSKAHK